jgi:hypothetical protein
MSLILQHHLLMLYYFSFIFYTVCLISCWAEEICSDLNSFPARCDVIVNCAIVLWPKQCTCVVHESSRPSMKQLQAWDPWKIKSTVKKLLISLLKFYLVVPSQTLICMLVVLRNALNQIWNMSYSTFSYSVEGTISVLVLCMYWGPNTVISIEIII